MTFCPCCGAPRIVLVCGGRDYDDARRMWAVLDEEHAASPIALLVHGDAPGADRLAGTWAAQRGVHAAAVAALWSAHGKGAGPRRNAAMLLLEPSEVITFPGGRGTADMVARARARGIPVVEVKP